jgi:hypothetical protein
MRNRIINGAMVIDQRNAGASITPTLGQFSVDRWEAYLTQASKYSLQQDAGAVTPPAGFTDYLGATSLSAYSIAAGDIFSVRQQIEGYNMADLGWGTANAKTVTLSFWVRSSLTGTFGGSMSNSAWDRSYPFSYTISAANTWELKSITIAGDTSGTWLTTNGVGIRMQFGLGVGSTYSGTAGSWSGGTFASVTGAVSVVSTNGATFYITGVQLEVGTQATSFEYRQFTTELQLCQRYYQKIGLGSTDAGVAVGATTTTTSAQVVIPLRTTMRASPTVTVSSMNITDWQTYTTSSLSLNFTAANRDSVIIAFAGSGFTAFRPCFFTQANTSSFTDFSAEL